MDAVITAHVPESVKSFVLTKSAILSGSISGLGSFAITEFTTNNTVLAFVCSAIFSTGSAVAVAYFRSRAPYTQAIQQGKLDEAEMIGKRTNAMLERLERTCDVLAGKVDLHSAARHDVNGGFQAALFHITLCHEIMIEGGLGDKVPHYEPFDVAARTKQLDEDINKLTHGKFRPD